MVAETLKQFLQSCEFKNARDILECFEELLKDYTEENLLQECSDLVDKIIEEKKSDGKPANTSKSEVQERLLCERDMFGEVLENYGIEIGDRRSLVARVTFECFFGNYVRLLESMQQPVVPDTSTADLAEDERDIKDLLGIVVQFFTDHEAYPDVLDGASKCVEDLNEGIEWLLYQKNKHMVSTGRNKQKSFNFIQELFTWIGIESNETEMLFNLPPHANNMLFEIKRCLESFPTARQCFHSLRGTRCDFDEVIQFVKDFPEFCDAIYGPAKWRTIGGTTLMREMIKQSSQEERADKKLQTVETLLKYGANVNHKLGKDGYSLLHHAFVSRSSEAVVKLLLQYNADTEQPDKSGQRPYEMIPMNDTHGIQRSIKNTIKDHHREAQITCTLVWEKAEIMKERPAKMRKGEELHLQWRQIPADSTLAADLSKMYTAGSTEMHVNAMTDTRFDLGSMRLHEGTDEFFLRLQKLPNNEKGKVTWEMLENKQSAEWSPLDSDFFEHQLQKESDRRKKAGDIEVKGHGTLVPTDAGYELRKPNSSATIGFLRWRPSWCFAQTTLETVRFSYEYDTDEAPKPTTDMIDDSSGALFFQTGGTPTPVQQREPVQFGCECDIDETPKPTTDMVVDSNGAFFFQTQSTPTPIHQRESIQFGYEYDNDEAPKPVVLDIGGKSMAVPENKDGLANLLEEVQTQKRDAEKAHEKNKERQKKNLEELDQKKKEFEALKKSTEETAKKVKAAESDETLTKKLAEKQDELAKLGKDLESLKVSEESINSRVKKSEKELANANWKLKETEQILEQQKVKAEKLEQEIAEKKKEIEHKRKEFAALKKFDEKEKAAVGQLEKETQKAWEALKGLHDAKAARLARHKSMVSKAQTLPEQSRTLGIVNVISDHTVLEELLKQEPDYRDLVMLQLNERFLSAWIPKTLLGGLEWLNRAWWSLARCAEKHHASIDAARNASLSRHMHWLSTSVLTNDYRHMPMAKTFKDRFERQCSDWLEYHTNKYKEGSNKRFQQEARKLVGLLGSRPSRDWEGFWNELKDHNIKKFDMKIKTLEDGFAKHVLIDAAQQQLKSMRNELSTRVKDEVETAAKKQGLDEEDKRKLRESLQIRFQSNQHAFNANCKRLEDELQKKKKDDASVLQSFLLKFSVHFSLANDTLPIYAQSPNMIRALKNEDTDVLVVECDTGSGKSTVLAAC
jgi:hypothetical protein